MNAGPNGPQHLVDQVGSEPADGTAGRTGPRPADRARLRGHRRRRPPRRRPHRRRRQDGRLSAASATGRPDRATNSSKAAIVGSWAGLRTIAPMVRCACGWSSRTGTTSPSGAKSGQDGDAEACTDESPCGVDVLGLEGHAQRHPGIGVDLLDAAAQAEAGLEDDELVAPVGGETLDGDRARAGGRVRAVDGDDEGLVVEHRGRRTGQLPVATRRARRCSGRPRSRRGPSAVSPGRARTAPPGSGRGSGG